MSDWAEEKAREWFKRWQQDLSGYSYGLSHNDWLEISAEEVQSLAALLREVALSGPTPDVGQMLEAARHREDAAKALLKVQMAEVRRVIESETSWDWRASLLSRLERL